MMRTEGESGPNATNLALLVGLAIMWAVVAIANGCEPDNPPAPTPTLTHAPITQTQSSPFYTPPTSDPNLFRIVAESAIKPLENDGLFTVFSKETGIALSITYRGPVTIRNAVGKLSKDKPVPVDAYWPGSTLWLPGSYTVEPESVMKTFVVLAVDPDVAAGLGWDTVKGISASDVIDGIRSGDLKLAMTSATQSTPGAAFYLAMYTALTGKRVLTSAALGDAELWQRLDAMFKGIERSAVDLDRLEQVFAEDKISSARKTNAIVIYENLAIQMNQRLIAAGQKPMTVFYVKDATAIADVPIRYVDNGDKRRLDQYRKLVDFLNRPEIQKRIRALGWRTCPIGMTCGEFDPAVFNPGWGVDTQTEPPEMIFPKPPVMAEALNRYQTQARKPSFTIYCLDYSASMDSNKGREQMVDSMDLLLDQDRAAQVLLQATPHDVVMVYGFSSGTKQIGERVQGNDRAKLKELSNQVSSFYFSGGTAMFDCVRSAVGYIGVSPDPQYSYSIIVLTDGQSNEGFTDDDFDAFYKSKRFETPVYGIAFGYADFTQLETFKMTGGDVYDGRQDVANAFLMARGNN